MRVFLGYLLGLGLLVPAAEAGRVRDHRARAAFVRVNHCPATDRPRGACPGWVVDHVIALECGGPDDPSNMQWQTVAEGKAKDKWERKGCRRGMAQ